MEVVVAHAVWDGKKFDRSPFSDNPPWIKEAMDAQRLGIVPTDFPYAVWAVKTNEGEGLPTIAEPGDKISNDALFGLVVTKLRRNTLLWEHIAIKDEDVPTKK